MSDTKLSSKEKREHKDAIDVAFRSSAKAGLMRALETLKQVEEQDNGFARELQKRATKAASAAVNKGIKADFVKGLTLHQDIRGLIKQVSSAAASKLDKLVIDLVKKAIAKAYKTSYWEATAMVGNILEPQKLLDEGYQKDLEQLHAGVIKPPLLHSGYQSSVVSSLAAVKDEANRLVAEIERQDDAGQNPLQDRQLLKDLMRFDKWFGVIDDSLDARPRAQLDRLVGILVAVGVTAEELRKAAAQSQYPVYDVSAAHSLVTPGNSPSSKNPSVLTDQRRAHTSHNPERVYLDRKGYPLYRLRGRWIACAKGFKKLRGSPSRPGTIQVASLVHEWVHALNRQTGWDINAEFNVEGGHIRLQLLDISQPIEGFDPELALLNPSTWGAIIAGKEFEQD